MRKLTTCCGCCSLKMGTIITGACGLLVAILAILRIIRHFAEEEDTDVHLKLIIAYVYIYTVVDVMLLYGAVREYKDFLLPWIVHVGFGIGLSLIFCLYIVYLLYFMYYITGLITGAVITGSLWYTWYCVISFYNELNQPPRLRRRRRRRRQPLISPLLGHRPLLCEDQPTSTIIAIGGYPGIVQASYMASSVVSYEPQPPSYPEQGKGPINV